MKRGPPRSTLFPYPTPFRSGLSGPPLELDTTELERGTPGATLGYPGSNAPSLSIDRAAVQDSYPARGRDIYGRDDVRSEEHTSELQSRQYLVCRLLLEKKKR